MTRSDSIAHVRRDLQGNCQVYSLKEHLGAVGELAGQHAARFGGADWARLAGRWHDLGKYREGFQRYIRQSNDPDAHIEGHYGIDID